MLLGQKSPFQKMYGMGARAGAGFFNQNRYMKKMLKKKHQKKLQKKIEEKKKKQMGGE